LKVNLLNSLDNKAISSLPFTSIVTFKFPSEISVTLLARFFIGLAIEFDILSTKTIRRIIAIIPNIEIAKVYEVTFASTSFSEITTTKIPI